MQLRLLEQPVFDVEGFLLGQAPIFGHRIRPAHHIDRIDVELAGNARRRLVFREGDHADARHQIDDGIGIAKGRAVVVFAPFVIGLVALAVVGDGIRQSGQSSVDVRFRRVEIDDQRADLGAQEMVGAGRAQRGQTLHLVGVHELQHRVAVGEMPDHMLLTRHHAPDRGHQAGRGGATLIGGQALMPGPPEGVFACGLFREPVHGGLDDVQRQVVAVPRVIGPGEQPVAFQHDAPGVRVPGTEVRQPQAQLVSRLFPRQPADGVAEDLLRQGFAVPGRRDGDNGVGVHVIDVPGRDIGVQRRVDAGRAGVQVEGAMGQVGDHLVFVFDAAI